MFKKLLVLSPHTDDGEIAAGAAIHRLISEGVECRYIAFSDCKESVPDGFPKDILRTEVYRATAMLGIESDKVSVYDYPVRKLGDYRQEILEELIQLKRSYDPDLVMAPSRFDIHQDHKTIAEEALRAFKTCTVLGYDMPWNCIEFETRMLIKITGEQLDRKLEAINMYESQLSKGYIDGKFIRSLASVRGAEIREEFAEAFEVMRWVYK